MFKDVADVADVVDDNISTIIMKTCKGSHTVRNNIKTSKGSKKKGTLSSSRPKSVRSK